MGTDLWSRAIHPITSHFRKKRGKYLLKQFPHIREARICDLGGSRHFWEKLALDVPTRNITIVNLNEQATQSISGEIAGDYRIVIYDGTTMPFDDKYFDLLICNSVIEHVPVAVRESFVRELNRVARQVFLQTPAYEFPFEPHFLLPFIHWLPKPLAFHLINISPWKILSKPTTDVINEYFFGTNLLKRKEIVQLFPEANIATETIFQVTKSYYVIRA